MSNKKSGFTLIEVLCSVLIVGVVSCVTVPYVVPVTHKSYEYQESENNHIEYINQLLDEEV